MRWHLLATIAAMLVAACSSSTNVGTGNTSGGVGSGNGSGGASGGNGAGSSTNCTSLCAHILSGGCAVPTQRQCMTSCQQAAQACPGEAAAAGACMEGQGISCDDTGTANVVGCDAEESALQSCMNGGSGGSGGGSGSSGGSGGSGGSGSGSSSGGTIPPGGSCADSNNCTPIQCTCKDGTGYGPMSFCLNGICQGTADECPMLCSNDGGW
jgi:hypothetical protein